MDRNYNIRQLISLSCLPKFFFVSRAKTPSRSKHNVTLSTMPNFKLTTSCWVQGSPLKSYVVSKEVGAKLLMLC